MPRATPSRCVRFARCPEHGRQGGGGEQRGGVGADQERVPAGEACQPSGASSQPSSRILPQKDPRSECPLARAAAAPLARCPLRSLARCGGDPGGSFCGKIRDAGGNDSPGRGMGRATLAPRVPGCVARAREIAKGARMGIARDARRSRPCGTSDMQRGVRGARRASDVLRVEPLHLLGDVLPDLLLRLLHVFRGLLARHAKAMARGRRCAFWRPRRWARPASYDERRTMSFRKENLSVRRSSLRRVLGQPRPRESRSRAINTG